MPRIDEITLRLGAFGARRARVYLPKTYDGTKAFPLLVMFDGQNVFEDKGSFAGGWRTHRAVERLAKKRPKPIVVGLDHGGAHRIAELAPFATPHGRGRGDAFTDALVTHGLPELRARLHVVAGPAGVLVAGSSLGGLAATYAHFRRPDAIGGALAMSPSFWLGGGAIVDFLAAQPAPWTSQIYLDAGARERSAASLVERVAATLRHRGYDDGRLMARVDPKGSHNERSWRRRLPAALRFFYR